MNRSNCFELLLAHLAGVVILASCSSHAPAIPPAKELPKNVQTTSLSLQQAQPDSQKTDYFSAKVLPIVEKCQPCHFKGGKVYTKLPFDDPKTIIHLGTKLFSRIQDEKEQAIIRAFLAANPDSTKS